MHTGPDVLGSMSILIAVLLLCFRATKTLVRTWTGSSWNSTNSSMYLYFYSPYSDSIPSQISIEKSSLVKNPILLLCFVGHALQLIVVGVS